MCTVRFYSLTASQCTSIALTTTVRITFVSDCTSRGRRLKNLPVLHASFNGASARAPSHFPQLHVGWLSQSTVRSCRAQPFQRKNEWRMRNPAQLVNYNEYLKWPLFFFRSLKVCCLLAQCISRKRIQLNLVKKWKQCLFKQFSTIHFHKYKKNLFLFHSL
jgi:hypothetical protein